MKRAKKELYFLSDALLKTIREHGIKEISIEQYKTVLKKIVCFADEMDLAVVILNLKTILCLYKFKCREKIVCFEYARFQQLKR